MPRDKLGRFLPGEDPERHVFTKKEQRDGYTRAILMGRLPSRLRVWLRNKIKRHYLKLKDSKREHS